VYVINVALAYGTVVAQRINDGLRGKAMAVDNFYLDMNGIIHMCTHSNMLELNEISDEDMFVRIFAYTDSLYKLVQPKKLLYLAVDGVAPRAKVKATIPLIQVQKT
jgi:5'-3' exoribonuclease 1